MIIWVSSTTRSHFFSASQDCHAISSRLRHHHASQDLRWSTPSNFHQIPPIPRTVDLIHWLVEAVFAVACYVWFCFCCFFVTPYSDDPRTGTPSESLDHYLRRIWLPQSYVANYLLPVISSVCTCSHQELLCFSRPPMSWTTSVAPIASSITSLQPVFSQSSRSFSRAWMYGSVFR